jgi:hypothetical protein
VLKYAKRKKWNRIKGQSDREVLFRTRVTQSKVRCRCTWGRAPQLRHNRYCVFCNKRPTTTWHLSLPKFSRNIYWGLGEWLKWQSACLAISRSFIDLLLVITQCWRLWNSHNEQTGFFLLFQHFTFYLFSRKYLSIHTYFTSPTRQSAPKNGDSAVLIRLMHFPGLSITKYWKLLFQNIKNCYPNVCLRKETIYFFKIFQLSHKLIHRGNLLSFFFFLNKGKHSNCFPWEIYYGSYNNG